MAPILEIRNLTTKIPTRRGLLTVVDDVSFSLNAGECFGIVGESGSGKSMTCRSVMGLVPDPGITTGGQILFDGQDLRQLPETALEKIRGKEVAMIVQNAMAALNPVVRIGHQIAEAMIEHGIVKGQAEARVRTIDLMRRVGIPAPETRIDDYPHQFSGGMCQRVVIAAALSCAPRVILADEPTTALDVTVQDQILKLLVALQRDLSLTLVLVSHDLAVVAGVCDRIAVMYAGQLVEIAPTRSLFAVPRHPYTSGLLNCAPRFNRDGTAEKLLPIPGLPPDLGALPSGCRFHPRCPIAGPECRTGRFGLREVGSGHFSACIKHDKIVAAAKAAHPDPRSPKANHAPW